MDFKINFATQCSDLSRPGAPRVVMECKPVLPDGFECLPFRRLHVQAPRWRGNPWKLVDLVVRQAVVLPNPIGAWSLEWEGGWPALIDDGRDADAEDGILFPEDMFSKMLARRAFDNAKCVCFWSRYRRIRVVTYDSLVTQYKDVSLELQFGASRARNRVQVCFLPCSRQQNALFYWPATWLYARLQMVSFKRTPSKWC